MSRKKTDIIGELIGSAFVCALGFVLMWLVFPALPKLPYASWLGVAFSLPLMLAYSLLGDVNSATVTLRDFLSKSEIDRFKSKISLLKKMLYAYVAFFICAGFFSYIAFNIFSDYLVSLSVGCVFVGLRFVVVVFKQKEWLFKQIDAMKARSVSLKRAKELREQV